MLRAYKICLCFSIVFVSYSCANDDGYVAITPDPESPVVFDIDNVPYDTLSEYNFFEGDMADLNPVYGVLPFDLNSTLFTDYAKKKRFVWMPDNAKAFYDGDHKPLSFPTGTILIKNFYYENVLPDNSTKIIETRLMIKQADEWTFANYVWNEEQTEASYTTMGSFLDIEWMEEGQNKSVNYRIPSFGECFTCHNKYEVPLPIGPKPQNLNRSYVYDDGVKNQLSKWVEQGYLDAEYPTDIVTTVDWTDTSEPLSLRARSYFDINCAHCHSDQGYCEYTAMRFEFNQTESLENLGVCGQPGFYINDELELIVSPNDIENSILHFRVSSVLDEFKMPLIGRNLVHEEGVALIEEWILSLTNDCE